MSFVRKGLLTISGQFFTPGQGVGDNDADDAGNPAQSQPSSVICVVTYYAPVAAPVWPSPPAPAVPPPPIPRLSATIVLSLQTDGLTWKGTWDTSVAAGHVDWAVYSVGSVVAAAQGNFIIKANPANILVN